MLLLYFGDIPAQWAMSSAVVWNSRKRQFHRTYRLKAA
jgi:hypothetical protein